MPGNESIPHDNPRNLSALERFSIRTDVVLEEMYYTLRKNHLSDDLERIITNTALDIMGILQFAEPASAELTEADWHRLIDPRQPTIAIDTSRSIMQGALLAIASQQLRAQGEPSCNIVLVPQKIYSQEHHTPGHSFIRLGGILDKQGNIFIGPFPQYLHVDATNGHDFHEHSPKARTRYINTPAQERLLENKRHVHALLAAADIPHAPKISEWQPRLDQGCQRLMHILAEHPRVVLKPEASAQGHGVLLFDANTTNAETLPDQASAMYAAQENVLIEEWVESLPLHDEHSGVRLDWNLRVLAASGEVAGMYARVGRHGGPINIHQGAEAWSTDRIFKQCGLDASQQADVIQQIQALVRKTYGAIPAHFMGFDIILNPSMQAIIIEINSELSGGLGNCIYTQDRGSMTNRLEVPMRFVRAWRTHLFPNFRPSRAKVYGPSALTVAVPELFAEVYRGSVENQDTRAMAHSSAELLSLATILPEEVKREVTQLQQKLNMLEWPAQLAAASLKTGQESPGPEHNPRMAKLLGSYGVAHIMERSQNSDDKIYRILNQVADAQPSNIHIRRKQADALLPRANPAETIQTLATCCASSEAARAYGRALFWQTADILYGAALGLSHSTSTALETTLVAYLQTPLDRRTEHDLKQAITSVIHTLPEIEQEFLEPLVEHLTLLDNVAHSRYDSLMQQINRMPVTAANHLNVSLVLAFEAPHLYPAPLNLALGLTYSKSGEYGLAFTAHKRLQLASPEQLALKHRLMLDLATELAPTGLPCNATHLEHAITYYDTLQPPTSQDPIEHLLYHLCTVITHRRSIDIEDRVEQALTLAKSLPGAPLSAFFERHRRYQTWQDDH